MGRPKRLPGQVETRDRILDAATSAFAQRGFDGAPLEAIAESAGIRRPSLLYHFPNKQALYSAVIERAFQELSTALTDAIQSDGTFEDRLERLTERFDRHVDERPQVAQLILREILDDRGPGRDILLAGAVPILDMIEAFIRASVAPEVHVRAAIMAIASSGFVRSSAGALAIPMWGPNSDLVSLAKTLLLPR